MSTVTIDCHKLQYSAKRAGEASSRMNEYANEIENKITRKIDGLFGVDNNGYASVAKDSAYKRIK